MDFDRAELRQMIGDKLGIEQTEPAPNQVRNQMHQRNLTGVPCP